MVPGRLLPLAPSELLHQRDRSIPRGRPRAVARDVRRPGRWDDDPRTPRPCRFVNGDRVIGGVSGDAHERAIDRGEQIEGPLVRVTADAAYDTVAVYETARARGATVVVPPARTANVSGHGPWSPARDRTIMLVKKLGRRRWKKASGYHRQSRVENAFFRYKSIIGDSLRARSPAGQGSEAVLGCEILNRMTALGRPVSYRIGR